MALSDSPFSFQRMNTCTTDPSDTIISSDTCVIGNNIGNNIINSNFSTGVPFSKEMVDAFIKSLEGRKDEILFHSFPLDDSKSFKVNYARMPFNTLPPLKVIHPLGEPPGPEVRSLKPEDPQLPLF